MLLCDWGKGIGRRRKKAHRKHGQLLVEREYKMKLLSTESDKRPFRLRQLSMLDSSPEPVLGGLPEEGGDSQKQNFS